jgi:predicted esterase
MSSLDSLRNKIEIEFKLPSTYYYKQAVKPSKKTVLLLHGYQDSASALLKRAFTEDPEEFDFNILAPNGLYPVPVKADVGFREAYAWYFVDGARKFVLVAPEIAQENLYRLIGHLNLLDHQFVIVGFSQGGILAPFVAKKLETVSGIVGVGTMFFSEYYKGLDSSLPVDSIHGIDDDVITLQTSQTGYDELKKAESRPGSFYSIKGLKHTLDDEGRKKLRELIKLRFQRD